MNMGIFACYSRVCNFNLYSKVLGIYMKKVLFSGLLVSFSPLFSIVSALVPLEVQASDVLTNGRYLICVGETRNVIRYPIDTPNISALDNKDPEVVCFDRIRDGYGKLPNGTGEVGAPPVIDNPTPEENDPVNENGYRLADYYNSNNEIWRWIEPHTYRDRCNNFGYGGTEYSFYVDDSVESARNDCRLTLGVAENNYEERAFEIRPQDDFEVSFRLLSLLRVGQPAYPGQYPVWNGWGDAGFVISGHNAARGGYFIFFDTRYYLKPSLNQPAKLGITAGESVRILTHEVDYEYNMIPSTYNPSINLITYHNYVYKKLGNQMSVYMDGVLVHQGVNKAQPETIYMKPLLTANGHTIRGFELEVKVFRPD